MALVNCPSCGLPRTAADAGGAPCPACGWKVGDPIPEHEPEVAAAPEPAAPPPPPPALEPEPHTHRNRWLALGIAVAAVVVLVAMLDQLGGGRPAPLPVEPDPPQIAAGPPPAPILVPTPPDPPLEVAPPPREAGTELPESPAVPIQVPNGAPGGGIVIRLDNPDEDSSFPRLTGGTRVKLVGRVRKLVVEGLDGGATLDASELATGGLIIDGTITGGATLLTKIDGGPVQVRGTLEGGARVTIAAPGSVVTFSGSKRRAKKAKDGHECVAGGAQVKLTARSVTIYGAVSGPGTLLDVTFTPKGLLRFTALEDMAKIVYRAEHRADPVPKVMAGTITGGAGYVEEMLP